MVLCVEVDGGLKTLPRLYLLDRLPRGNLRKSLIEHPKLYLFLPFLYQKTLLKTESGGMWTVRGADFEMDQNGLKIDTLGPF